MASSSLSFSGDFITSLKSMPSELFVRGMLYLSLTVLGVPGNTAIILAFHLLLYQENRLLRADIIVLHLAWANLLVVGVRCLLETLASFCLANIFGDTGCKAALFIHRTSRSLSIWITFVLSAYQCLSLAPPGSHWASVCAMVAHNLSFVFHFIWLLNTCVSSTAILFSFSTRNNSIPTNSGINIEFCFLQFPSRLFKEVNGAVQVVRDVVPIALMTLASVDFDNGLGVYTITVRTLSSSLLSDLCVFFSSLYAALSPVVIIASNRKVNARLRCVVQKKATSTTTT
uniref:Vomeronasal type-1 receptor n=1 Tax=Monopterus albus TaxID=43700 RepID=A0A3Q3IEX0_MONAL